MIFAATYYNVSNFTDPGNFVEFTGAVNTQVNGLYAALIPFCLFFILYFAAKQKYDSSKAFVGSTFACAIVAIILALLQWMAPWITAIYIVLFGVVGAMLYVQDG